MGSIAHINEQSLQEDFEDLFENSLNGYLFASPEGTILRVNSRLASWLGASPAGLLEKRFSDYLSQDDKIVYETVLAPLLRKQGFFDEVPLQLKSGKGSHLPVFVNALERKDANGKLLSIRFTLFKGTDRTLFEQNLRNARNVAEGSLIDERQTSALREQFIAVLSHDLRNPLSAIVSGITFLERVTPLNEKGSAIIGMVKSSAGRMSELINDVMDFARGRLGEGITIKRQAVMLEPILQHVVDELRSSHPNRIIETELALPHPVNCDSSRLSQLLSNLVANALTHGAMNGAVHVFAQQNQNSFELSVSNTGNVIPAIALARLFQPFTRDEIRPSQQGLGLGLYIAAEVARAHGGELTAKSTTQETRFTFRMPLAL